jgi:hypothetical protein
MSDIGKIDDDIGRLLTLISRARSELRGEGFVESWRAVAALAADILRQAEPPAKT